MVKFKKLLKSLMIGAIFSIFLAEIPHASADAWNLPLPDEIKAGEELVAVEEGVITKRSLRRVTFNVKSSGDFDARVCDVEYESGDCNLDNPDLTFEGRAVLGLCESISESNCIESLSLSTGSGPLVAGTFLRSVATQTYAAVANKNLPAFKSIPLFSVGDFKHLGGSNTYAPVVRTSFNWDREKKRFYASSFEAHVIPYNEKLGEVFAAPTHYNIEVDGRKKDIEAGTGQNCVWEEKGKCGVPQVFAENVQVHLALRLSSEIVGWFRGRLTSPEIQVLALDSERNRITISGEPVAVSRFGAIATKTNTTESEQALIQGTGGNPGVGGQIFGGRGRRYVFSHWGDFTWLEQFRDIAKDTALGESRTWSVSTIDESSQNKCLADQSGLLGIVTTNATVYDGKVPEFVDGELIYKVAGMHYMPDGKSLVQGTYDLVMKSETARCLYGFSSAPVTATISVLSSAGTAQIATTLSGERNGWLYLSAKNFNFSVPTIKVKLSQEKPATASSTLSPTPSPSASIVPTVSKKKTITCVKGQLSKKVVAVSPKCPKGYKKV